MRPITHLLVAGLLLLALQVSGQQPLITQFSTTAPSPAPIGSTVVVTMKVTNFTQIISLTLPTITFNTAVLRLDSVRQVPSLSAFPAFCPELNGACEAPTYQPSDQRFGQQSLNYIPAQNRLSLAWAPVPTQSYLNGITRPAGSDLLRFYFKVMANGVTSVNITAPVSGQGILEVTNKDYLPVTVNYQTGGVTITAGDGTTPPPPPPVYTGFKLIANTIYIPQNEVGCMPLTVNDFDSIVVMTYAVDWNPAVLEFSCARAFDLPTLNPGNFYVAPNSPGRMVANWDGPTPTPSVPNPFVSKPDGAKILELCYKAKGAPGTTSMVTPNGNGFPQNQGGDAEVLNAKGVKVWNSTSGIGDTMYVITNPATASAVTFTVDKDTAAIGSNNCVDVKVKNFNNISYAEFGMVYDTLKLSYQSINLGTNPLSLTATAAQHQSLLTSNDEPVKFVKFAFTNANGVTVADNTTIFSVCFTTIGPVGSTATVELHSVVSNDPTICIPIGAAKKTSGSTPIKIVQGHVVAKSASQFTVAPSVGQALLCNNSVNGVLNANATNCSGSITYVWTGPGITASNKNMANPTGLIPGSYTVVATCSAGGNTTANIVLTAPPAITQTNATAATTCPQGADGAISITTTGGTAPYTYQWAGVGITIPTKEDQTGLVPATYKVTVTDANGCTFVSGNIVVASPPAIDVASNQITITNVKCRNGSDGAIAIGTITGGTAPYSYLWTGPAGFPTTTTKDIAGLKAGSYTLVISDSKGCSKAQNAINILEPAAALSATGTVVTNVACFGASDAEVSLTVTGGTNLAAATYSWKNAGGTQVSTIKNPDNLGAGTYNVTVTDANGCTTNLGMPLVVTGPPSALVVGTAVVTPASCGGTGGGTISLPISGGNGNYLTNWTSTVGTIPSGANLTGLQAGTYIATVTDMGGNGCSITQTVVVAGPPAITIGTPNVTNITCNAAGNGGIVITPAGGSGSGYSIAWTGGLSGSSISTLAAGTYTPTVTDGSGCTAVFAAITITEPSAITFTTPTITMQTGGQPNGGFIINVSGGSPAYTYELKNESAAVVASGAVVGVTISNSTLVSGTYTLIIKDANGCMQPKEIVIPGDFSVTFVSKQDECNDDGSVTLQVAASGVAPFTVSGMPGFPQPFPSNSITVGGLPAGVYTLTVTDAATPTHTFTLAALTINQKQPALIGENINQPQQALGNGSIILSPNPVTAPMTYVWNDGSTQSARVNLDQGEYCVTVTNLSSGCTASYCWTLTRQYPALVLAVTATNPNCAGANTGSITANVSGGNAQSYLYKWTGPGTYTATTKTITGLAPGVYNLTVTDAQGTTAVLPPVTLTAQSNLDVTNVNILSNINGFPVSGATLCDGVGNVVFTGQSGATSILWSNGATTAQTNALCGGAYSVTVTDAIGCTDTWTGTLTAPPAIGATSELAIQYGTYGVSCPDACNGAARVKITGGVLPYQVKWPTGQNDQILSTSAFSQAVNLCAGDYTVTITDDNAVTSTHVVTVSAPDPMTVQFSDVVPQSFNSCDGQLLVEVAGGVGPFEFTWDGSFGHVGETQRAERLCAGEIITFNIQDANGCEVNVSDTIAYPKDGCFQVSPVLTPGEQDGLNDYIQITCIDQTQSHTFQIFNRAGQLVFTTSQYLNNPGVDPTSKRTWYGLTRSGEPYAEGVYFYVLTYVNDLGKEVQAKGYINLLK